MFHLAKLHFPVSMATCCTIEAACLPIMSTHEAPALTDWLTERFPPGRARAPSAAESGLSARDGHGTRGYGERELPGSEIRWDEMEFLHSRVQAVMQPPFSLKCRCLSAVAWCQRRTADRRSQSAPDGNLDLLRCVSSWEEP